ncbi:uncharacterized protein LOC143425287 [Xylocopa sonorina]|uniref:uncharacterized protein LOC143425287 n=1 Tax=Xylocopa sonorina TaxID=1818115 RepID=UPI00403ACFAE
MYKMKWILLSFTLMTWNYIISCQDIVFPNVGYQTHYDNTHNSMVIHSLMDTQKKKLTWYNKNEKRFIIFQTTTQSSSVTKLDVLMESTAACPENMKRYPLDETASTWICDCIEKFLYFPSSNSCYAAYEQGPCKPMNYVVLPKNATEPKCVGNPCLTDGLVPYNNSCYPLKSTNRQCTINGENGTVDVNESTFELECSPLDLGFHLLIQVPRRQCPAGSRRNSLGMCREEIK